MKDFLKEIAFLLVFTVVGGAFILYIQTLEGMANYGIFLLAYVWGFTVLQAGKLSRLKEKDGHGTH